MRIIKTLLRNLHRYVFLLMACAFLLTWFYYIATELPAKKKVAVYINAPEVRSRALEAELEKSLPEGIKAIRVHPFAYDIMGVGLPAEADILIMMLRRGRSSRTGSLTARLFADAWSSSGLPMAGIITSALQKAQSIRANTITRPSRSQGYCWT